MHLKVDQNINRWIGIRSPSFEGGASFFPLLLISRYWEMAAIDWNSILLRFLPRAWWWWRKKERNWHQSFFRYARWRRRRKKIIWCQSVLAVSDQRMDESHPKPTQSNHPLWQLQLQTGADEGEPWYAEPRSSDELTGLPRHHHHPLDTSALAHPLQRQRQPRGSPASWTGQRHQLTPGRQVDVSSQSMRRNLALPWNQCGTSGSLDLEQVGTRPKSWPKWHQDGSESFFLVKRRETGSSWASLAASKSLRNDVDRRSKHVLTISKATPLIVFGGKLTTHQDQDQTRKKTVSLFVFYLRSNSSKLLSMMILTTSSKMWRTCLVSVAHVKWWYTFFFFPWNLTGQLLSVMWTELYLVL